MNMTVLIQANKTTKKSFVLSFQNSLTPADIKKILKSNPFEAAVRLLISRSSSIVAVQPESEKTVGRLVDFIVGDSFTSQSLA